MVIRQQFLALAAKIQEAALAMCHDDIQTRLRDCLNDSFKGTGNWCYIQAVFGDDKSGDVVYSCNGDLMKAPYTMTKGGATIDTSAAVGVLPLTTYEVESVMALEAGARNSKRDMMQLQTIHDSAAALGANCSMKESHQPVNTTGLKLVESMPSFCGEVAISEAARTSYPVLLISPGTGSTAHYPADVLQKACEAGRFPKGSLMFWNHATAIEEANRPEGDLNNLAAILTTAGRWDANGVKGPGVYAEAKVMADYAQKVEERAPHIGLSIRAGGTGTGRLVEGKPELKSIDYVESVDYVTKAGRGGMALAEAARDAGILDNEVDMDEAQVKRLIETAVKEATGPLHARIATGEAEKLCRAVLGSTGLTEAQKDYVTGQVIARPLPMKEGALDAVALTESVNATMKAYSATLPPAGQVTGMGTSFPVAETDPAKIAAREAAEKRIAESDKDSLARLFGGDMKLAEMAASKGVN